METLERPQKMSRYRSVRKAQQVTAATAEPIPPPPPVPDTPPTLVGIARSRSRYRRSNTVSKPKPPPADAIPLAAQNSSPVSPQDDPVGRLRPATNPAPRPSTSSAQQYQYPGLASPASRPSTAGRDRAAPVYAAPPLPPLAATTQEGARQLMAREAERQRRMREKIQQEKRERERERLQQQRAAEEADRRRREEEEREEEARRLQKERERAEKEKAGLFGKLGKKHRRSHDHDHSSPPDTASTQPRSAPSSAGTNKGPSNSMLGFGFLKKKNDFDAPTHLLEEPKIYIEATIRPGGGGIVPRIDAPISAANAGDRRVVVECGESRITLPVTPTTTPVDLIRSAETCLTQDIDTKTAVLLELYEKVGVQRPLRRYERVRDVLNSWDQDTADTLILIPSSAENNVDLTAAAVPLRKPTGSWPILYSQTPSKWSKRFVFLNEEGQVTIAKNRDAPSKDHINVCRLSDFDIYTPTPRQRKNKVKPPKKHCFAIKSQEKSSMFMSTATFVHFFCTADKQVADEFYCAIQGWRSWYLVHVLGEGKKKPIDERDHLANGGIALGLGRSDSAARALRRNSTNSIESHYQLGSFQPLLDLSDFTSSHSRQPSVARDLSSSQPRSSFDNIRSLHSRQPSIRTRAPPSAFPNRYRTDSCANPTTFSPPDAGAGAHQSLINPESDDVFSPTSLLGRTYSQRQRAQKERERIAQLSSGNMSPFTGGPSLLNSLSQMQSAQYPPQDIRPSNSSGPPVSLSRAASVRSNRQRNSMEIPPGMPKPLVDLTPQYRPPPQHARKGRGVHMPEDQAAAGAVLIGLAGGGIARHDSQHEPSGSDHSFSGPEHYGAGMDRSRSLRGHGMKLAHSASSGSGNRRPTIDGDDASGPFTGMGLLAASRTGQGDAAKGHGVMSGSHARGPMLDMREQGHFAEGSLLGRIAQREGDAPIERA